MKFILGNAKEGAMETFPRKVSLVLECSASDCKQEINDSTSKVTVSIYNYLWGKRFFSLHVIDRR